MNRFVIVKIKNEIVVFSHKDLQLEDNFKYLRLKFCINTEINLKNKFSILLQLQSPYRHNTIPKLVRFF